ncbi:MAG TPA: NAD(P)H-dependent oxidoreductase [Caulobacteraceae bacterium]|jgi:NAD(P)H-dependent FMN reductase|nr:NAD(P)H-dependent oxidoreductase [Caulobacteraceae bacterium]
MSVVSVIVGTTRPSRFSEKPARWIRDHLAKRPGLDVRLLDLRDYPMPFFDEAPLPGSPDRAPYEHEAVKRWTAAIAASDAFVFVTGEYNFGPPAVLKNAIDYVYPEWNRKPAAFVGYGSVGGARSVQQLRLIVNECQMMPIRRAVHLPVDALMTHFAGGDVEAALKASDATAELLIDDLLWWTEALKTARAKT